MEIIIAHSALRDLDDIKGFYLEQGVPEIGHQFVRSILEHIQTLLDHPDSGRKVPEFDEVAIRELIIPPFRAVYLRTPSTINLVRVWRSERILQLPDELLI